MFFLFILEKYLWCLIEVVYNNSFTHLPSRTNHKVHSMEDIQILPLCIYTRVHVSVSIRLCVSLSLLFPISFRLFLRIRIPVPPLFHLLTCSLLYERFIILWKELNISTFIKYLRGKGVSGILPFSMLFGSLFRWMSYSFL